MGVEVVDAHHHRVRHLARSRRLALSTHVADDDRAVAETELRAMVLADLHALDKAEGPAQPAHRIAHVRVDEDRYDRVGGDRSIRLHWATPALRPVRQPLSRRPG